MFNNTKEYILSSQGILGGTGWISYVGTLLLQLFCSGQILSPSPRLTPLWSLSRGGSRVQHAVFTVLTCCSVMQSRVSLRVLQVSRRDWGPVLGTDMDRMDSEIVHLKILRGNP